MVQIRREGSWTQTRGWELLDAYTHTHGSTRMRLHQIKYAKPKLAHIHTLPKSFTVSPFNGVYHPRFRLSTGRSRSNRGKVWCQQQQLFLRTVSAIGLSQALDHVKMCFATSILYCRPIREGGSGTRVQTLADSNRRTVNGHLPFSLNAVER